MDDTTKFAIIQWINCLNIGPHLSCLKELHDGRHFISLIKIIRHASEKQEFVLKNWTTIVINFLEEYYEVGLGEEIHLSAAKTKNEYELAKIAILILCASIHCERSQQFVKELVKLDVAIQLTIKTIFEGVLHPSCNTTLNPDFSRVLKSTDSSATGANNISTSAASKSAARSCAVYTNDDENNSPIKQYLQSPQVVHKMILREKMQEISRLKANLATEVACREELENDLKAERLQTQKRASDYEILKKTVSDLNLLNGNLQESQHLLELKEAEILKLQASNGKLKDALVDYDSLQAAFKTLTKENQALEDNCDKLERTLTSTQNKVNALESVQFNENQYQQLVESKSNEIANLKEQLLMLVNELEETRNMYREAKKNNEHTPQDPTPGENMAVVSDMILLEQSIQRLQEEILAKDVHVERLIGNHRIDKSELEQKLKLQMMKAQDLENELTSFKVEFGQLKDSIAVLDVKLKAANDQRISERQTFKSSILSKREEIARLQDERTACEDRIAQLETLNCDLESKNNGLVKEKSSLETDLMELHRNLDHATEENIAKCAEISNAKDLLNEASKEITSLKSSILSKREEIARLWDERTACDDRVAQLEALNCDLDLKNNGLMKEKSCLEADLMELHRNLDHATDENLEKCAEISNVKDLLNEASKEITSLKLDLNAEKDATENLNAELKNGKVQAEKLNFQVSEMEVRSILLESEKGSLNLELNSCKEMLEHQSANLSERCSELSTAQARLKELNDCNNNLELTVAPLRSKTAELENDLSLRNKDVHELKSFNSVLESQIEALSNENSACKTVIKEMDLANSTYVAELKTELANECRNRSLTESEKNLLKEEMEHCCKKLDEREVLILQLQQTIANIESKCDILVKEKDSLTAENCAYGSKVESLVQELQTKLSELSAMKDVLEETEKGRLALLTDFECIKNEKEKCEDDLNEKDSRIERLTSVILDLEAKVEAVVKEQLISNVTIADLKKEANIQSENLQKVNQKWENDLDSRNMALEKLAILTSELELKILTLSEEKSACEAAIKEMDLANSAHLAELKTELANECRNRELTESEKKLLSEELEQCCKKLDEREVLILQHQQSIAEVESKCDILVGEKDILTSDNGTYQCKIESLEQKAQTKLSELSALQAILEQTEKCRTALLAEFACIKNENEKSKESLDGKDSEIKHLTSIILDLEAKNEALLKEQLTRDVTITDLKKEAHVQSENLQKVNQKWGNDLDLKNMAVEKLEVFVSELELKILTLSEERSACETAIKEMDLANSAYVTELKAELANECQNRASAESEKKLLSEELEQCGKKLDEREVVILRHQQTIAMVESKCDILVGEKDSLTTENGTYQCIIESLKQETQTKVAELSAMQEDLGEKDREIERLTSIILGFEAKMDTLTKELLSRDMTIADLKKEAHVQSETLQEVTQKWENEQDSRKCHEDALLKCYSDIKEKDTVIRQLEQQIHLLKNHLERDNNFLAVQKEMTEQVLKMKDQVNIAEQKHLETVRMMEARTESISLKYEKAKSIIEEMSIDIKSKESRLEEVNIQFKSLREQYDLAKEKLTNVMSANKKGEERFAQLQKKFRDEQEHVANQSQRIKKLEAYLKKQQQIQQQNIDPFVKPLDNRRPANTFLRRPSVTVMYNSAEKYNLKFDDSEGNLPDAVFSINAAARDVSTHATYNPIENSFNQESRALPSGAGSYFTCEDEEGELLNFSYINDQKSGQLDRARHEKYTRTLQPGTGHFNQSEVVGDAEFSNFSYLNDLKSGQCEVPERAERLSELQRRNTLCLPHLKSSYPVEMQAELSDKFKDEDLKTSRLDMTGLSQVSTIYNESVMKNDQSEAALGARPKQAKPIQPTYQKPGPPTPGKSGKSAAEKVSKTPSSLKRLWRRQNIRTPKGKMPPKKSKENQPEQNQALHARRNITFAIGFSPKVKSRPKSVATSKVSPKKTSTPLRRKES